jgi:hypothetical protein
VFDEVHAKAQSLDNQGKDLDPASSEYARLRVRAASTYLAADALELTMVSLGEAALALRAAEAWITSHDAAAQAQGEAMLHSIASSGAAIRACWRAWSAASIHYGREKAEALFGLTNEGMCLLEDLCDLHIG